jgi:hypothetical protein
MHEAVRIESLDRSSCKRADPRCRFFNAAIQEPCHKIHQSREKVTGLISMVHKRLTKHSHRDKWRPCGRNAHVDSGSHWLRHVASRRTFEEFVTSSPNSLRTQSSHFQR